MYQPGEPGEGIWRGTLTPDASNDPVELIGLVDGWGGATLMTSEAQYVGQIRRHDLSDNEAEFAIAATGIALNGSTWPDGSRVTDFLINGTLTPLRRRKPSDGAEINADYAGDFASGTMALSFDFASIRELDVSKLDGAWALRGDSEESYANFEIASGSLEGEDNAGCVYSGSTVVDTFGHSVFLYDVTLSVANCLPSLNGTYWGAAGLTDVERGSEENDWLIVTASNKSKGRAISLPLERM
jgi:hypothetical protein